eukprot:scpid94854/ scgid34630/ 
MAFDTLHEDSGGQPDESPVGNDSKCVKTFRHLPLKHACLPEHFFGGFGQASWSAPGQASDYVPVLFAGGLAGSELWSAYLSRRTIRMTRKQIPARLTAAGGIWRTLLPPCILDRRLQMLDWQTGCC